MDNMQQPPNQPTQESPVVMEPLKDDTSSSFRASRGIDKLNFVDEVVTIDGIPDDVVPFDRSETYRMRARKALMMYQRIRNKGPKPWILSHETLNPRGGITNYPSFFKLGIAASLIWTSIFGPQCLPRKLSPSLQLKDSEDLETKRLIELFANLFASEFDELKAKDLKEKNLYNFRRALFTKVKHYGVWSNSHLEAQEKLGKEITDKELCKGLQFEFALIAHSTFQGFYDSIKSKRMFITHEENEKWNEAYNNRLYGRW